MVHHPLRGLSKQGGHLGTTSRRAGIVNCSNTGRFGYKDLASQGVELSVEVCQEYRSILVKGHGGFSLEVTKVRESRFGEWSSEVCSGRGSCLGRWSGKVGWGWLG